MKLDVINISVFIASFLLGIMMVHITAPETKTIIVYPTYDYKDLFQFRDSINNCFQLNQKDVECSKDAEEIPVQI